MNHDATYQRLRETAWRRELSDTESAELHAWLAAHPKARDEWDAEAALTLSLSGLKDAPVASNFTARVLAEAARETAVSTRVSEPWWRAWWRTRGWLPKAAIASAVLALGVFSIHRYQTANWNRMVRSVASFSKANATVKTVPSPEILQDFDAISQLAPVASPDNELLTLLK